MNTYKILSLSLMLLFGQSYGAFFKNNQKDKEYFKKLLNKDVKEWYRATDLDIYSLLTFCANRGPLTKYSAEHRKERCLHAINELDSAIDKIRSADKADPILLDLLYLKNKAINREFDTIEMFK